MPCNDLNTSVVRPGRCMMYIRDTVCPTTERTVKIRSYLLYSK
jgi:hypothetical protein